MLSDKFVSESVGRNLRDIRRRKGVTNAATLAELMGQRYSSSGILRREEAKLKIDSEYLDVFCKALGIEGLEKEDLLTVARLDLWRSKRSMLELQKEFYKMQSRAKSYKTYCVGVIPAEFETFDYAFGLLRQYESLVEAEQQAIERVKENKALLEAQHKEIRILCAESSLYKPITSPIVMLEQLHKLAAFLDSGSVEFRIFADESFCEMPTQESFTIYDDKYVLCESRIGMITAEDRKTVDEVTRNFEHLWVRSASGVVRSNLITQAIQHYTKMSRHAGGSSHLVSGSHTNEETPIIAF